MIGTFLADAKEMREIAGERGAFVYANTISKARRKAIEFSKAINQGVEVKLSTPLTDVTEVRFKTDDLSVSVKL
jgi:hypothetical protein